VRGAKRRVWRKFHLGIDVQTLKVRAVEVTGSNIGDPPMLPERLNQIPGDQQIGSVTAPSHGLQTNHCRAADGAYDTGKCHDAIHCPAVEAKHGWRHRPERCAPRLEVPGPGIVAELEWLSSQKSR